jgi:hypothetical protein
VSANTTARALGAVGVACLALGAWLAWPSHGALAERARELLICAVDDSASATRTRPDWEAWALAALEREAREASAAGEELCVLRFASDYAVRFGPASAARFDADAARAWLRPAAGPAALGSDAAGALKLAAAVATSPARPGGRVRIFSDRRWTSGAALAELGELAALGFAVEAAPLDPPESSDLAVRELRSAPEIEAGAPIAIEAELELAQGARASATFAVELEVETSRGRSSRKLDAALPSALPGESVRFPLRLDLGPAEPGATHVRLAVHLDRDPVPENDAGACAITAKGSAIVAVVASAPSDADARAWLGEHETELAGLQPVFASPAEFAEWLPSASAVVTIDLAPSALPGDALASFVRRGGGWLACGGFDLLAHWPNASTGGAAALLPLVPSAPDSLPRDVVLLVDGSGSMAGEPFDALRRAALELCERAPASDRLSLRIFTDRLGPEIVLREAGAIGAPGAAREGAERLIAATLPGGGTDIDGALSGFAAERERADRPSLALLLTDGRDQAPDDGARSRLVRARLSAARAKLAILAVGERADRAALERWLLPGESIELAPDPADLARLFDRALAAERVRSDVAITCAVAGEFEPRSLAAELAAALSQVPQAPLERAWRAEARPGAQILCRTGDGEPVLAIARAGSGVAAVWTSCPDPSWASSWRAQPQRIAPLLRGLARGARDGGARLRIALDGERLALEGVPPGWPAQLVARLRARSDEARPRELASVDVALSPPAIGFAGAEPLTRREGDVPAGALAVFDRRVEVALLASPQASEPLADLALDLPPAPEFTAEPVAVPALAVRRPGVEEPAASRLAPWALALGIAALAVAVILGWERAGWRASALAAPRHQEKAAARR